VSPDRIVAWAARACALTPGRALVHHTLALSHLRAGDTDAAARAVAASRQAGAWVPGMHELASALIALRRGQTREASDLFEKARLRLDHVPDLSSPTVSVPLPDWLEFLALRPQFVGPLYDAEFPADPFAR
jgi:hypothetical protein